MAGATLRSTVFRQQHEHHWRILNSLVTRVERSGLAALSGDELQRLPSLYRTAVSSLGVARAISLDRNLVDYLESLVSRAYFCIYGVKPRSRHLIVTFFLHGFPAAVREHAPGILLATAIILAGILAGMVSTSPEAYAALVSPESAQGRTPMATTQELRDILYSGGDSDDSGLTLFATKLFTNNANVGFLSFALGFALGLPSLILLLYNGLSLGAMGGLYGARGLGLEFWGWILPHGVTELGAICLCGGAGLHLALAIIRPGRYGRLYALGRAGRRAVVVVFGAVLMFLVAGLIEGFFRQRVQDLEVRYLLALVTLGFWLAYFGWCGRVTWTGRRLLRADAREGAQ